MQENEEHEKESKTDALRSAVNTATAEASVRMQKAWSRARVVLEKGKDELARISRVGKMKLDLSRLQRERNELYRQLGQECYQLLKEQRFEAAEVERYLARVDRLNDEIEKQREQMSAATQKEEKQV